MFHPLLTLGVSVALVGLTPAAVPGAPPAVDAAGRYLDSVRDEPDRLAAYLRDMPKGGDLHMHLGGATSTETLLRFAVEDGLCIEVDTHAAVPPPCGAGRRPASDTTLDEDFRDEVIRAWSMEDQEAGFARFERQYAG